MTTTKNRYFLSIVAFSLLLTGCVGTRHVKEDEQILYRQKIQAPRNIERERLNDLFIQRHNRKFLFTPLSLLYGIYHFGEKNYDQEKYIRRKEKVEKKFEKKISSTSSQKKLNNYEFRKQKRIDRLNSFIENGNLRMQWGEPLALFDTANVSLSKERFTDYLFSQGYFTAKVESSLRKGYQKKLIIVDYKITPGEPYIIDSIFYYLNNPVILKIINDNAKQSLIKKGERYNQDNFTKERERLDLLLKDNGFYDFSRQYIEYEVDSTSLGDRKIIARFIINDPAKRGYHKQFVIDSINFITDAGNNIPGVNRQSRPYRQIRYHYYVDSYNLKILSQRVFLQPDSLYSRANTFNTQRQLANVDAFKFININYDTTGGKFVANIFSSPLPRYEWSNEAGVSVTQGFPGPFYSISFRKRNIFKGLENFELNGRFGFEGVASATSQENIYKSTEASINASLTFPQFIWPFKERVRFKLAQYNPKTRLTTGYAYTDRPEYRRTAISLNGSYAWQNNKNRSYLFTPFNVSVINAPRLSPEFQDLLDDQARQGNLSLVNSFRQSFVTSMIFGITWNNNNYGNIESNSGFTRIQLEAGGTIWNFISPSFITDLDLQYFKYLRLSVDVRRINVLNKTTTLAYRFNGGMAYSYTKDKSLPYEKFFFAGGSNGIRAWRPRRLGQGSFKPDSSANMNNDANPRADGLFNYSIEKPGDILLEGSIELRKKLFGFVSGALFIDAGNTWTFEPIKPSAEAAETEDYGNSQFRFNQFYKEIGVGTGFGLRFDFAFLILRLDIGMKIYDPARDGKERFVLDDIRFWKPYATERDGTFTDYKEPVIYNVGIGYSF